jgi:hypothetical protein
LPRAGEREAITGGPPGVAGGAVDVVVVDRPDRPGWWPEAG